MDLHLRKALKLVEVNLGPISAFNSLNICVVNFYSFLSSVQDRMLFLISSSLNACISLSFSTNSCFISESTSFFELCLLFLMIHVIMNFGLNNFLWLLRCSTLVQIFCNLVKFDYFMLYSLLKITQN